jgi:hypothetical protein
LLEVIPQENQLKCIPSFSCLPSSYIMPGVKGKKFGQGPYLPFSFVREKENP